MSARMSGASRAVKPRGTRLLDPRTSLLVL
jgi:hypothetical protein